MTSLVWARYIYLALVVLVAGAFAVFRLFKDDENQVRRR